MAKGNFGGMMGSLPGMMGQQQGNGAMPMAGSMLGAQNQMQQNPMGPSPNMMAQLFGGSNPNSGMTGGMNMGAPQNAMSAPNLSGMLGRR